MKNKPMKDKLHLGCGQVIKPRYVNVDHRKQPGVDRVVDLNKFPYPFKDNTFVEVFSDNVFEHLEDIPRILEELRRICKNNALIIIKVPFYNCKGAYNDTTHKHFFNYDSFDGFCGPMEHRSNLSEGKFEMVEKKLFPTKLGKLFFPSRFRYLMSMIIGEVYSEIKFTLKVRK
jgi:ubiquinone/menaquinone biosynthesis C-methylase UbiE